MTLHFGIGYAEGEFDETGIQAVPKQEVKKKKTPSGRSAVFACKADPRFSFSLYVPKHAEPPRNLLVSVHGSARDQHTFREVFVEFAERTNTVVLAPLFPIGVSGDDNSNGYKYLREDDIHYDRVLLDMVAQAEQMLSIQFPPFFLFGFSGGGHFAHRFFYLHPQKLKAVSISAPGSVTLLDREQDWWVGVADIEQRLGGKVDLQRLQQVPVHLSVGLLDIETREITHVEGGKYFMPGANAAGRTRIDRNDQLKASLLQNGVRVQQDRIPNVGHNLHGVLPATLSFLNKQLDKELEDHRDC